MRYVTAVLAAAAILWPSIGRAGEGLELGQPVDKLPGWATWQVADAKAANRFAAAFFEKFIDAKTGKPCCTFHHGTADDVVEGVQTWDRFAITRGDARTRANMVRLWQYIYDKLVADGDFVDGFYAKPYDAEHMGEFLQMLWACQEIDPLNPKLAEQNRRVADVIIDRCWNPKTRLIKHAWLEQSGGNFFANRPGGRENPAVDEVLNTVFILSAFRAYATTGDAKYRDWLLSYGGKWNELAAANGGVFPFSAHSDTGKIPEKWWKGVTKFDYEQWGLIVSARWLHGWPVAMMLSDGGSAKHLSGLNSTLDRIFAGGGLPRTVYDPQQGKWIRGNRATWFVPKLVDRPYAMTFDRQAGQRIRDYDQAARAAGQEARGEASFLQWHMFTYFDAFDLEWAAIQFKNGVDRADRRRRKVEACTDLPKTGDQLTDYALYRPLEFGLVDGSFFGMYDNGRAGCPSTAVLGYWTDAKTPGLPAGVAALVRHVGPEGVRLLLANTTDRPVSLHLVGGAYGTHRIDAVVEGGRTRKMNIGTVPVLLLAKSVSDVTLKMTRFANRPTLTPLQ